MKNTEAPVPLYYKVQNIILSKIKNGELKLGEQLPSEISLCEEYKVSRNTMRRAIQNLVNEGWLVVKQGKGTFVTTHRTTLNFATWLATEKTGIDYLNHIKFAFEAENPMCKLNIIPIRFNDMQKQLTLMISTGTAPDIAQIRGNWTTFFASMGALEPLNKYISMENIKERWDNADIKVGTYQDTLYSVAWTLAPIVLYSNLNVLEKFGVDANLIDDGITLEGLIQLSKDIKNKANGKCEGFGIPLETQEIAGFWLSLLIKLKGGELIDDDGRVVMDSENTLAAFHWLKDKIKEGSIVLFDDIDDMRKKFAEDQLAFMFDVPPSLGRVKEWNKDKLEIKITCIPRDEHGTSNSWVLSQSLCIFKQSQNKELAGKLIEFLTGDKQIAIYSYKEEGFFPPLKKHVLSKEFKDFPFIDKFQKQINSASLFPVNHAYFSIIIYFFLLCAKNILLHDLPVEAELRKYAEVIRNLIYYDKL